MRGTHDELDQVEVFYIVKKFTINLQYFIL